LQKQKEGRKEKRKKGKGILIENLIEKETEPDIWLRETNSEGEGEKGILFWCSVFS
jgi:hypothetical protein